MKQPHISMKSSSSFFQKCIAFLDTRLFPFIVTYTTHRAHILVLFALWIALLIGGSWTTFELVGGNYTNGLSALVSCIVLLTQMKQHEHIKRLHTTHAEEIAKLHEKIDALSAGPKRGRPKKENTV